MALEGTAALDDYDILANRRGLNIPDIQTLQTTVTDGVLNLEFLAQVNVARIRGIEIRSFELPNAAPTITASPNPAFASTGRTTVVDLTGNDPRETPSRRRSPRYGVSRGWSAASSSSPPPPPTWLARPIR